MASEGARAYTFLRKRRVYALIEVNGKKGVKGLSWNQHLKERGTSPKGGNEKLLKRKGCGSRERKK